MFFELIATIFSGLAAAGIVLVLRSLVGGRLPRWLTPVAAGLAMIGFAIWNEYTWFERTAAALPPEMEIVAQNDSRALWRPWTYVVPFTDRFAALDRASVRWNDAAPDQRMADLFFWGRWAPVNQITVVYDCDGARRAALVEGIEMDGDGRVTEAAWTPIPETDPALRAACAEG